MKLIILEENFKKEEFIIRKGIDNVDKGIKTRYILTIWNWD